MLSEKENQIQKIKIRYNQLFLFFLPNEWEGFYEQIKDFSENGLEQVIVRLEKAQQEQQYILAHMGKEKPNMLQNVKIFLDKMKKKYVAQAEQEEQQGADTVLDEIQNL